MKIKLTAAQLAKLARDLVELAKTVQKMKTK